MTTIQQAVGERTFTAGSLREALAQVRSELGSDALILGQNKIGHRVAVRACQEMPQMPAISAHAESDLSKDETPTSHAQVESVEMQAGTPQNDVAALLAEHDYSQEISSDFPNISDLAQLRGCIVQRLNFAHRSIAGLQGKYRFVGASGVGKSASMIKILVEWVMHNGPRDVVVISTDNERLAGTESLQLTCQMLNVTMRECPSRDLVSELERLKNKALVLVDSPALNMRMPVTQIPGLKDLWVCSAMHAKANLVAQHRFVRPLQPVGLIVTQLDQVAAPDAIANLLYQWRLPLYWYGTSNHLPEGIEMATEESTTKLLFEVPDTSFIELTV